MRDFLDEILAFIGSESLTDIEFESIDPMPPHAYVLETYQALKTVLETREGVSGQLKRLKAYFIGKGVDVDERARTPSSQIFVGSPLE